MLCNYTSDEVLSQIDRDWMRLAGRSIRVNSLLYKHLFGDENK